MTEINGARESLSKKITQLTKELAYMDADDRLVTSNQIRRLQHKLNDLDGIENACDIGDEGCLSCGA